MSVCMAHSVLVTGFPRDTLYQKSGAELTQQFLPLGDRHAATRCTWAEESVPKDPPRGKAEHGPSKECLCAPSLG